jgi:hypothetical protein
MIIAILFLMLATLAAFHAWGYAYTGTDVVLEVGGWMCPTHRETHPDGMRCCLICGDVDEIVLHGTFEKCPRQLYDDCADCRRIVRLDRYGRCSNDAKHTVAGAIRSTRRRRD